MTARRPVRRRVARLLAVGMLGATSAAGVLVATAAPASAQGICLSLLGIPLLCPPTTTAAPPPTAAPTNPPPATAAPSNPAPNTSTPTQSAPPPVAVSTPELASPPATPTEGGSAQDLAAAFTAAANARPSAGQTPSGGEPIDTSPVARISTALKETVTEPRILVVALTLALGVGVLAGAGRQLPRYRRRQRRLLTEWDEAAFHEREVASRHAEAVRQKSDFLALVSHELRTPLTAVKGFLDTTLLYWDGIAEAQRREMLGRVANNADELQRLVNQLLEFARSDAGAVEVLPEPLDVATEVRTALRDLAPVVGRHRVEVDVPGGLTVMADRDGFGHVLVNLLTNAVKFSPEGTTVRVRAYDDGDEAVVSVIDEGPGIAPADQARVFERFYQAKNGESARGTGIGLTIAQRFTELHGGEIWVESQPGAGATFAFSIPRTAQPAYV